jgi:hydrogenase maturation protein HypF
LVVDWRPLLTWLVAGRRDGTAVSELAAAFHEALAEAIVTVAQCTQIKQVLLTGGCFQNARLTQRSVMRLRAAGFAPHWHRGIPPNDGGIAIGQLAFALRPLTEEQS